MEPAKLSSLPCRTDGKHQHNAWDMYRVINTHLRLVTDMFRGGLVSIGLDSSSDLVTEAL